MRELEFISKEKFVNLFLDFVKRLTPPEIHDQFNFSESGYIKIKETLNEIEESITAIQEENEELKEAVEQPEEQFEEEEEYPEIMELDEGTSEGEEGLQEEDLEQNLEQVENCIQSLSDLSNEEIKIKEQLTPKEESPKEKEIEQEEYVPKKNRVREEKTVKEAEKYRAKPREEDYTNETRNYRPKINEFSKYKSEQNIIDRMKDKMSSLEEKLNSFYGEKYRYKQKYLKGTHSTNIYLNNVQMKTHYNKSYLY